jgi:signal peptidase I
MNNETIRFVLTLAAISFYAVILLGAINNQQEQPEPVVVNHYFNETIIERTNTVHTYNYEFVEPSQQCKGKRVGEMYHDKLMGYSMQPAIFGHDTLLTVPYQKHKPVVSGDIIIFSQGDSWVVHRVIAVYPEYVITKGDFNQVADQNVAYKQIIGIVCGVLKG